MKTNITLKIDKNLSGTVTLVNEKAIERPLIIDRPYSNEEISYEILKNFKNKIIINHSLESRCEVIKQIIETCREHDRIVTFLIGDLGPSYLLTPENIDLIENIRDHYCGGDISLMFNHISHAGRLLKKLFDNHSFNYREIDKDKLSKELQRYSIFKDVEYFKGLNICKIVFSICRRGRYSYQQQFTALSDTLFSIFEDPYIIMGHLAGSYNSTWRPYFLNCIEDENVIKQMPVILDTFIKNYKTVTTYDFSGRNEVRDFITSVLRNSNIEMNKLFYPIFIKNNLSINDKLNLSDISDLFKLRTVDHTILEYLSKSKAKKALKYCKFTRDNLNLFYKYELFDKDKYESLDPLNKRLFWMFAETQCSTKIGSTAVIWNSISSAANSSDNIDEILPSLDLFFEYFGKYRVRQLMQQYDCIDLFAREEHAVKVLEVFIESVSRTKYTTFNHTIESLMNLNPDRNIFGLDVRPIINNMAKRNKRLKKCLFEMTLNKGVK